MCRMRQTRPNWPPTAWRSRPCRSSHPQKPGIPAHGAAKYDAAHFIEASVAQDRNRIMGGFAVEMAFQHMLQQHADRRAGARERHQRNTVLAQGIDPFGQQPQMLAMRRPFNARAS